MDSAELTDDSSWNLDTWISYLTDEIICERGVVRFHLIAPAEGWIEPLAGATAVAMESLWQQVRSVLTRNGMSFAVARSRFEMDSKLGSIPDGVLIQISAAAQKAKDAWPKFPHFGDRADLPALEDLLPLPQSNIRHPVVFSGRNGGTIRLHVNATVAAESSEEQGGKIEYWPSVEGPVECLLESDEGGGFIPLVQCRLQRLYPVEAELFDASKDRIDACQRFGLKDDLLRALWPRITSEEAEPDELAAVLHILRDAWEAYETLSLSHSSLLYRRDTYWDAIELIRKQMTREELKK